MKNNLFRKFFSGLTALALLTVLAVAPAAADNHKDQKAKKSLTELTDAYANFSILKKALKETGLDETLKTGNYTIFAPNDDAFKKLPAEELNKLLADRDKLKQILLYHVVEGKMLAADVVKQSELKTAEGTNAKIKVKENGKVKINGARILKTDILASNGVLHVIDTVIVPGT